MSGRPISGALAAAVTPLLDHGEALDEAAFAPLYRLYSESGLDGVLVLGTTGEGIMLEQDERRAVATLAVANAGELRVIVHCGAQTTRETTALADHAAREGADGVAVIGPPYYAFDEEELVEHFAAAAAACAPLPFYLYEFADRTGYAVPVEVVRRLRERADNLVGIKVSDWPFERIAPYLTTGLDVFIGQEPVIAEGLQHGAVGTVSGVAGAFPEAVVALVHDPSAQRVEAVGRLRGVLSRHGLQASVKAALGWRGVPVRGDVRAPLRALSVDEVDELGAALERAGDATALPAQLRQRLGSQRGSQPGS
jgi:dihydrodipicolinate synthase/N-acetylneuraminate lyase